MKPSQVTRFAIISKLFSKSRIDGIPVYEDAINAVSKGKNIAHTRLILIVYLTAQED